MLQRGRQNEIVIQKSQKTFYKRDINVKTKLIRLKIFFQNSYYSLIIENHIRHSHNQHKISSEAPNQEPMCSHRKGKDKLHMEFMRNKMQLEPIF